MGLAYQFDWSVLARPEFRQLLLDGAVLTLLIAAVSTIASLLMGTLLAVARLSTIRPLRLLGTGWVTVARHVPGMFWVLFFFFAFPELLPATLRDSLHGWATYAVLAGIVALAVDNSSYVSDIVRGGVLAIPRGEREAAQCCGLSRWQQWVCCLLPLTVRMVVPPLANRTIHNFKNSSLCMVIGVQELTWASQQIGSITFRSLEATLAATSFYVVVGLLLGAWARRLERRQLRSVLGAGSVLGRARFVVPLKAVA